MSCRLACQLAFFLRSYNRALYSAIERTMLLLLPYECQNTRGKEGLGSGGWRDPAVTRANPPSALHKHRC